jgi:transcriptional regulator with XRE-family HTH domain
MTSRHGQAPTPPPDLWKRPDMAQALADRDVGTALRIFRRWTGASQTDVGMMIGIPQSHVSDIERGARRVTTIELMERIADGLGLPRTMLGLASSDDPETAAAPGPAVESQRDWLATRKFLSTHRADLTEAVYRLYPDSVRLGNTGILTPPQWRLEKPVDLSTVSLKWRDGTPRPSVNGSERESRHVRPLFAAGRDYSRYHRAMRDLAPPRLFENRLCYRGLDVTPGNRGAGDTAIGLALTLGEMCYFDMIDVGEALAHETAVAAYGADGRLEANGVTWENLPFRRLIRDPFDLTTYPLLMSISTLTVRASRAGATFFLLRRNPARVAVAGGMLSVFPTGVFQPASVMPAPHSPDFDLWRNVMREYSEEFLGNPEHDGDGGPIDYANQEPFRSFDAARRAGGIRVFCLGVGVDALNYAGDVLTVAVFDADVFDGLFGDMVDQNDEGEVDSDEFTFTADTIRRVLDNEPLAPSGAACLHLALQHRDQLI